MKNRKQSVRPSAAVLAVGSLVLGGSAFGQAIVSNPGTSAITPLTTQVEIGPQLDVVPYVLADGYTINLTLIPSVTQFNGYDNPTTSGPPLSTTSTTINGLNVVELPIVLPSFNIQQVITTVNVWDNQTVVIGGLISSQNLSTKDQVPVLGDLPLIGRLFQSQSKQSIKDNLMIFVTATIVDPAGNRVHSDDELPFAQATVPEQPVVEGQKVLPGHPTGGNP